MLLNNSGAKIAWRKGVSNTICNLHYNGKLLTKLLKPFTAAGFRMMTLP
jgi:hypothetical protein